MSPFQSTALRRRPSGPRLVTVLGALGLALALAAPASAGPQTLKRSIENLTLWPLDVATAPVVGTKTVVENLQTIDDTLPVKIIYPVPGVLWNTMTQAGSGVLRGFTGVFELFPGLVLLPFDAELSPLFDAVDDSPALVNVDSPVYRLKFGVTYTSTGGAQAIRF